MSPPHGLQSVLRSETRPRAAHLSAAFPASSSQFFMTPTFCRNICPLLRMSYLARKYSPAPSAADGAALAQVRRMRARLPSRVMQNILVWMVRWETRSFAGHSLGKTRLQSRLVRAGRSPAGIRKAPARRRRAKRVI